MATHRPALPPLKLVTALAATALAAVTASTATPSDHAASRPTASAHSDSAAHASCKRTADWNTMVPEGQCPA